MKSTKAIIFGFLNILIGIALTGFGLMWYMHEGLSGLDNLAVTIANYSTIPFGIAWGLVGYGLMRGKKSVAKISTRMLYVSFACILIQAILLLATYLTLDEYDSLSQSFDFTVITVIFEVIFYFVLLLPTLKSKRVQESLFR